MPRRSRVSPLPTALPTALLAALLAALLTTAGCSASGPPDAPAIGRCAVQLAYLGPLSGPSANLGQNVRDGVVLAIEEFNAARPGCPVRLADFDSQGDPKQAPDLAQRLVADATVIGVVGPAFSGESEAANPLLEQGGVTTITASATSAALAGRWSTFHRIIGSDAVQGPAAGRFIAETLAARNVFVIDDSQAYGIGLADQVSAVLGERVVQRATVPASRLNLTGTVAEIRAADPDVIFFGGYYQQAGALLRQVRAGGVRATFVSGDAVKDAGFLHDAGAAADGAVITCPCTPPEQAGPQFTARYHARFGRPPATYSTEGYDAAHVFLEGIAQGQLSRAAMASFVDRYRGQGLVGPIAFEPSGELVRSTVAVWAYRVRDGAIVAERQIPTG